jgi:hypothetical protein
MLLRTIGIGTLVGVGLTALLAVWDGVSARGHLFGLRTGMIGLAFGGIALLLALGMALISYHLASRDKAPALRQRLLSGAIWTGAVGMACGFSAAALWIAAGLPWFP